ncbi:MAG: helix-hairpin-helix domain-containing protein [bacterium]|nr:MAG: helix-hairpin-helix domain-containing protein [bacterium]
MIRREEWNGSLAAFAAMLAITLTLTALFQPVPVRGEVTIEPLDINTADVEDLTLLPGIGSAKAKAIVAYRKEHGLFTTVAGLLEVSGIGPSLLEKLEGRITVNE